MPLGKRSDCGDAKYAGLEVPFSLDVASTVQTSVACGFDFVISPLVDPAHKRPAPAASPDGTLQLPFGRGEALLVTSQYSNQVVGQVSGWIDPDSPDAELRGVSEAALRAELDWAAHLSLQACALPPPPRPLCAANYARILNQVMGGLSNMALWLTVPMVSPTAAANTATSQPENGVSHSAKTDDPASDPWEWWNQVRTLCQHSSKLGVLLEVPASLPSALLVERWRGEPVRALRLATSVFLTNKRGFPVLSRHHQDLLSSSFQRHIQVVCSGSPVHTIDDPPTPATAGETQQSGTAVRVLNTADGALITPPAPPHPMHVYWEYVSYLFRRIEPLTPEELLELSYRDYLQAPLQPLQDNLESQTYETFERDATKYDTYQAAIEAALLARMPKSEASTTETVVMVVGAGRGPLVRASMQAGAKTGRRVRVYALEKNPNAVISIQHLIAAEGWEGQVTLVAADMRRWRAPEQADILVSELLGSFGDNELSPECLDGAQRFLKDGGVSIPQSYTSFLQPITTSRMWNDVKVYDDLEHFETPYVVKLHRFTALATTQPAFTFRHPNPSPAIDNTRYAHLAFDRQGQPAALCHGLAGYFEAQLYGDVTLSIHPPTHTPHMFSWFPIYFPLKEPVYLAAGADCGVAMWRCAGHHKVWYEWALTAPQVTPLHNPLGRSYYVGL